MLDENHNFVAQHGEVYLEFAFNNWAHQVLLARLPTWMWSGTAIIPPEYLVSDFHPNSNEVFSKALKQLKAVCPADLLDPNVGCNVTKRFNSSGSWIIELTVTRYLS